MFGLEKTTERKKSYVILLVVEFDGKPIEWQRDILTLKNNLLRKRHISGDDTWDELQLNKETLEELDRLGGVRISQIDLAQSKEEALHALQEKRYDVAICYRRVQKDSIMGGTLNTFREASPNTMFISILNRTQRRGENMAISTGEIKINGGAGIQRMFDKKFYNALWLEEDFSIDNLLLLIGRGGRTKEEAYHYYGLDITEEEIEEREQGVFRLEEKPTTQGPVGNADKEGVETVEVVDQTETEPVVESLSFEDQSPQRETEQSFQRSQPNRFSFDEPKTTPNGTQDEGNLNRSTVANKLNEHTTQGIAMTGLLPARVSFAQGNTVVLALDQTIDDLGVTLPDLLGMPANVFYIKK